MWLPAPVVHAANRGSYIVKVIGGAEYRQALDHIHEHQPDAVRPDTHGKVEVAGQPVTTPSTSEAAPTVQPPVALATPKQAAAQSPIAATSTQWRTPATADVYPLTGRTDVAPC